MGVNSLPKTVTRQRHDCDLNPGPSAPESSMLTTRLPSHPSSIAICISHWQRNSFQFGAHTDALQQTAFSSILTHIRCTPNMLAIARRDELLRLSKESFKFSCWWRTVFREANKCKNSEGQQMYKNTHTHLFNGSLSRTTWVSQQQKGKTIWILLKQETASGIGISWAICKFTPHSRQITMSAPHCSVFYRLDALPDAQPTASKHWRQSKHWSNNWKINCMNCSLNTAR